MSDHSELVLKGAPHEDTLKGWREEIDEFIGMICKFTLEDPDTILQQISSISARLIEIRMFVVRSESRKLQAFRTKELDPLLEHVEFQFKVNSRRLSSMTLDWQMQGGAP